MTTKSRLGAINRTQAKYIQADDNADNVWRVLDGRKGTAAAKRRLKYWNRQARRQGEKFRRQTGGVRLCLFTADSADE